MVYDIERLPNVIDIGYEGEKNFRSLQFDLSKWMEQMPDGVPSLVYIRPGESDDNAYIAATTFEDNILTWVVTDSDASIPGTGIAQIWLEEQEESVVEKRGKSAIVAIRVSESLGEPDGTVPEPQEYWLAQMTTLKAQTAGARDAAEAAEASAISQVEDAEAWAAGTRGGTPVESSDPAYHNNSEYYAGLASDSAIDAARSKAAAETAQGKAENAQDAAETAQGKAEDAQEAAETAQGNAEDAMGAAEDAKDAAEDAQEAAETAQGKAEDAQAAAEDARDTILEMTATATGLAAGESPTVSYSNGVMAFGIPKGDKGDKGDTGATGAVPDIQVGTVTTGQPGSSASVTRRSGSPDTAPVFDFSIPKGDTGSIDNAYATTIPMGPGDSTKISEAMAAKADLDQSGKVPSSQLPSYVDDVLEYASTSDFPAEGETGKIYVALDTNKTYRWSGSIYVEISSPRTDASIVDLIYPVGSIYMSVSNASPSTLFGGTWDQIQGAFLYGCETSGIVAGDTGGAKSTDYTPVGAVGSHTLTVDEIPSHDHTFTGSAVTSGANNRGHKHAGPSHSHSVGAHSHGLNSHKHSVGAHSHGLNSHKHSVGAHSHGLNSHTHGYGQGVVFSTKVTSTGTYAYLAQSGGWGWYPAQSECITGGPSVSNTANSTAFDTGAASGSTADSTAFDTGAATGSTGNSTAFDTGTGGTGDTGDESQNHTHSVTAAGSVGSKGGGGSHDHGFTGTQATINTMPPYLAVYMWKRTA